MNSDPHLPSVAAPQVRSLHDLRELAQGCRGCPLWAHATQTVCGAGAPRARLMLVGEQPGDQEDLQGRPFVGPAGKLLDKCLAEAGIDAEATYITNAVKHFKWEAKGARRLHKRPSYREVRACYPWLEAEIRLVSPDIIVCLGSAAAQALIDKDFKVTQHRGEVVQTAKGLRLFVTIHPSAILRVRDDASRRTQRARFVADLAIVAGLLASSPTGRASLR